MFGAPQGFLGALATLFGILVVMLAMVFGEGMVPAKRVQKILDYLMFWKPESTEAA